MAVRLCEFESHPPYLDPLAQQVEHNTFNVGVLGSSPKRITKNPIQGAIAQLVEQRTENPCVPGSIPGGTTSGRLDEWFSLWSAKPATAVRVRYRPLFLLFGRLAQLVQSGCLTSSGSAVRIRQRPRIFATKSLLFGSDFFVSLILRYSRQPIFESLKLTNKKNSKYILG